MIEGAIWVTIALWCAAGICLWWIAYTLLNRLIDLVREMRKEILGDAQE